jgi:hypothetical protein
MIIELKGRVGEDGRIILETQTALPPGDVNIVIAYADESEAQDEAQWTAQFAATQTIAFDKLIKEGLTDYHNGQTDEFDPNVEDD